MQTGSTTPVNGAEDSSAVGWLPAFSLPACLSEIVCDENGNPTDWRIIDVNPEFEAFSGWPRTQSEGRLGSELWGDDGRSVLAGYLVAAAGQIPAGVDTCLGERLCHVTAIAAGEHRFLTFFLDGSSAGAATDYREFFVMVPDLLLVLGPGWQIVDCNPAAAAVLGSDRSTVLGRRLVDFFAEEWRDRGAKMLELLAATGRIDNEELGVAGSSGERRLMLCSGRAVRDRSGGVFRAALVMRDITNLRHTEGILRTEQDNFAQLLEQVGDGVIVADAAENCIAVNRAMAELLGVSREELLGQQVRRFTTAEGWERIMAETARRRTGTVSSYELEFIRPDGQVRQVLVSAAPRYGENGSYAGSLAVLHDITARRAVEAELSRMLHYATSSVREFGCLCSVSELLALSKASSEKVLAEAATVVVQSWPHAEVAGVVIRTPEREYRSAGFAVTPWEMRAQWTGGSSGAGEIGIFFSRDRTGTTEPPLPCDERDLLNSIARQIGAFIERRTAEAELRRSRLELEERVRARTAELEHTLQLQHDLVDMVMHDLGAPMQVIGGYAAMISDGTLGAVNGEQRAALEEMQCSIRTLESLRRDMLELSRFRSAWMELKLEPTDIAALVTDCIRELSFLIRHKGHRVVSLVTSCPVVCDGRRIKQVITNYLSNAIRYTPDSGHIQISSRQGEGWLEVAVQDNGRGIDRADIGRLFDKFEQSGTPVSGSSGIGLAVVKKIVEAHKGRVWCESLPGVGSTFYFRIPTDPRSVSE